MDRECSRYFPDLRELIKLSNYPNDYTRIEILHESVVRRVRRSSLVNVRSSINTAYPIDSYFRHYRISGRNYDRRLVPGWSTGRRMQQKQQYYNFLLLRFPNLQGLLKFPTPMGNNNKNITRRGNSWFCLILDC